MNDDHTFAPEMTAEEAIQMVLKRPEMYGLQRVTAVPDAATDGDYHEGLEEGIKIGRAERDAALAAIERVRAIAERHGMKPWTEEIFAALDGAPEPEGKREYRRVRPDGVPVFNAVFETMPLLDDYYTAEYRTVSPWLPVEGVS